MLCNKTWYMFPLARQPDKGTWHSFKKKKKKVCSLNRIQTIFIFFPFWRGKIWISHVLKMHAHCHIISMTYIVNDDHKFTVLLSSPGKKKKKGQKWMEMNCLLLLFMHLREEKTREINLHNTEPNLFNSSQLLSFNHWVCMWKNSC